MTRFAHLVSVSVGKDSTATYLPCTDGGHARTEVLWINPRAAALIGDRRAYQQIALELEAAE